MWSELEHGAIASSELWLRLIICENEDEDQNPETRLSGAGLARSVGFIDWQKQLEDFKQGNGRINLVL